MKGLAAAALLALSVAPAAACDDFDDEKALTAAIEAAKVVAQSPVPQQPPAVAPAPRQPTTAAITPAPTQTTENAAGVVRR